jgi:hypothetical protein
MTGFGKPGPVMYRRVPISPVSLMNSDGRGLSYRRVPQRTATLVSKRLANSECQSFALTRLATGRFNRVGSELKTVANVRLKVAVG